MSMKSILVVLGLTMVFWCSVHGDCQSSTGIVMSSLKITDSSGAVVTKVKAAGGVYTISGHLTISSNMAAHSSFKVKVALQAKVKVRVTFFNRPFVMEHTINLPCPLPTPPSCDIAQASCDEIASVLHIPSSTMCPLQASTISFTQTETIKDFTNILPSAVIEATGILMVEFLDQSNDNQIACLREELGIQLELIEP